MNKAQLEKLIERMSVPDNSEIKDSSEQESWKAYREAEKISDRTLLPLLEQIITEHRGEEMYDCEIRENARFIYAKIIENNFDKKGFLFLLNELFNETDDWAIDGILDDIQFLDIPKDVPLDNLLKFADTANEETLETLLSVLCEYKDKGNYDAIAAYPELYERVSGKRLPLEQAVAAMLKEYGINTQADFDKQTDEEKTEFYANLKSGILEEYDISLTQLQLILNRFLK
ncbi:MAG: hypothetical protein K2J68_03410 [Treponemataceae bacterium]|nr:hypothetical protein [Treponemataceae bacterium]